MDKDMSSILHGRYLTMYEMLPARSKKPLDYGCGEGHFTELIRQKYGVLAYGAEIDSEFIKRGKLMYPKVRFIQAREDGIDQGDFDLILLADVLEHIPEGAETGFVSMLAAKLKKGGTLFISTPHRDPLGINFWLDYGNSIGMLLIKIVKMLRLPSTRKGQKYVWENTNPAFHRHYALRDLEAFYSPHFRLVEMRLRGSQITPAVSFLKVIYDMPLAYLGRFGGRTKEREWVASIRRLLGFIPDAIINYDSYGVHGGAFSYHIALRLEKK